MQAFVLCIISLVFRNPGYVFDRKDDCNFFFFFLRPRSHAAVRVQNGLDFLILLVPLPRVSAGITELHHRPQVYATHF